MKIQELAQADIFFFITSISVVILTSLFIYVLAQTIIILRTIKKLSETFKEESVNFVSDMSSLRSTIKEKGSIISGIITAATIANTIKNKVKKTKDKK